MISQRKTYIEQYTKDQKGQKDKKVSSIDKWIEKDII